MASTQSLPASVDPDKVVQLQQYRGRLKQMQQQITREQASLKELQIKPIENQQEEIAQLTQHIKVGIDQYQKLHQVASRLQQQLIQQVEQSQKTVEQIGQGSQELHVEVQRLQEKTHQLHIQGEIPQWVIQKDEVQMTEEVLGTGGWAEMRVGIFRGTKVAVKCLHQVVLSEYNLDLFSREMDIASHIRHPNLLLFIGATRVGNPMMLTELMTTTLRKELEKAPLTKTQILSIGHDALNYLHLWTPEPIIHRDVSSANVLLEQLHGGKWKGKLSDYGSANFLHQIRTVAPGSPAYAAPEAVTPHCQSPKMDVYSFGVLFTEMVTRRLPFGVISEQIQKIQFPSIKSMIEHCTARDPQFRPTIDQVLKDIDNISTI